MELLVEDNSSLDVHNKLQEATLIWKGGIRETGGTIIQEKRF